MRGCTSTWGPAIGAGHVCHCVRLAAHDGEHGCPCGAPWTTAEQHDPPMYDQVLVDAKDGG